MGVECHLNWRAPRPCNGKRTLRRRLRVGRSPGLGTLCVCVSVCLINKGVKTSPVLLSTICSSQSADLHRGRNSGLVEGHTLPSTEDPGPTLLFHCARPSFSVTPRSLLRGYYGLCFLARRKWKEKQSCWLEFRHMAIHG